MGIDIHKKAHVLAFDEEATYCTRQLVCICVSYHQLEVMLHHLAQIWVQVHSS